MQPILRSSARLLASSAKASSPAAAVRTLSTSARVGAAAAHDAHDAHEGHEDHYDAPTGWLWGVRPGEKYEKEGWENVMYWGFGGSMALAVVGYAFKPDTSIQTWALEEARRRLEAEGILKEPETKQ